MRIENILREKGRDVVTVTGSRSVLEAVHILVGEQHRWTCRDGRHAPGRHLDGT